MTSKGTSCDVGLIGRKLWSQEKTQQVQANNFWVCPFADTGSDLGSAISLPSLWYMEVTLS